MDKKVMGTMHIIDDERRNMMAVSAKLRDLVRDATIGITDASVCEKRGSRAER